MPEKRIKKKSRNSTARKKLKISGTWILKQSDSALFRVSADSTVTILNLSDLQYYELSGAAAYFWMLLDGGRTIDKAIEMTFTELKIKAATFPKQALEFSRLLFLQNLVVKQLRKSLPLHLERELNKASLVKNPKLASLKSLKPIPQPLLQVAALTAGCGSML